MTDEPSVLDEHTFRRDFPVLAAEARARKASTEASVPPGQPGHACADCYEDPVDGSLFHPTAPN